MKPDPSKPWILWTHDPCQEGGWHIHGQFDTREEAVESAKALHAEEDRLHREMVDFMKATSDKPWRRSSNCYDRCMVTPNAVFELMVEEDGPHDSRER